MTAKTKSHIALPLPDHRLLAGLVGLLCGTLYVRTLAPTAMWYDMAEMAAAAYHLGIIHHTGYPLYALLGKLFTFLPVGDIAYRVNLMSAVFATGTVVVIFFIVWDLTRHRSAASLAALTLGVSSTLWSNATLAESYDLNAFLAALISYLMLLWQRRGRTGALRWAFVILGLGMGNHHLIQFFAPAMLVYWGMVRWGQEHRLPWRELLPLAGLFLLGFAINLYLPLRSLQKPAMMWADASDWRTFLKMITIGMQQSTVLQAPTANVTVARIRFKTVILFPLYEFTIIGVALAIWGAVRLWKLNRPFLLYTLVGSALTLGMILIYGIHNIFQYFLPIYVMMALWLGIGIAALIGIIEDWAGRSPRRVGPLSEEFAPLLLGAVLFGLPTYLVARDFPVLDRSQDYSAYDYARYLAQRLEPNARVLADFWAWAPLAYYQTVGGWRPDIDLSAGLSVPKLDWERFSAELHAHEGPMYVVGGLRLPQETLEHLTLAPVGINVVETMPTHTVPLPRFKDVWLPMMDLYRMVPAPPEGVVPAVPPEHQLPARRFGSALSLVGFGGPTKPLEVGEATTLSYYWRLEQPTTTDYYASIRFEDEQGYIQLLRGLVVWDHSHYLGGARPSSVWRAGEIVRERYDMIVPWRISPGTYTVKLWLYADESRVQPIWPEGAERPEEGLTLGTITVVPRRSGRTRRATAPSR